MKESSNEDIIHYISLLISMTLPDWFLTHYSVYYTNICISHFQLNHESRKPELIKGNYVTVF